MSDDIETLKKQVLERDSMILQLKVNFIFYYIIFYYFINIF